MKTFLWTSIFVFALAGCATTKPVNYSNHPPSQVYAASFDLVWRAIQLVMARYPLRLNNADAGLLETETIRTDGAWRPPFDQHAHLGAGYRYRLQIRVLKGKSQNRPAIKVVILKRAHIVRSFFSAPQKLASDGFEERALLYRIAREIAIDRALAKAQKSGGNQ